MAHTPKRDAAKPITVNDLQGSKMIMNFCDSAFAIGKSHSLADTLYLKQVNTAAAKHCTTSIMYAFARSTAI